MVIRHLAFGARLYSRRLVLLVTAVLILALGISASGVAHDVVLRLTSPGLRMSVDAGKVGLVSSNGLPGVGPVPDYYASHVREQSSSFSHVVAVAVEKRALAAHLDAEPAAAMVASVTEGFFEFAGERPLQGRPFTADEHQSRAARVIVISQGLSMRLFGGDTSAVGKELLVEKQAHSVVGVMPHGFSFPAADAWLPVSCGNPRPAPRQTLVYVRLRPGVSWQTARTETATIGARLGSAFPSVVASRTLGLVSLDVEARSRMGVAVFGVLGPSTVLLFVSCLGVGTLLLSSAVGREREIAVRAALGASRSSMLVQLLCEGLVVAAPAGCLGILMTSVELSWIRALAPTSLGWLVDGLRLRPWTVVFTFVLTILTPVFFSAGPAIYALRVDLVSALKAEPRPIAGLRRLKIQDLLVVLQVAGSLLVLLIFLMLRFYVSSIMTPSFAFDRASLIVVKTRPAAGTSLSLASYQIVLDELRAMPGVAGVTLSSVLPDPYDLPRSIVTVDVSSTQTVESALVGVDEGFFGTLGVSMISGRTITEEMVRGKQPVAVVSSALARAFWQDRVPIGETIRLSQRGTRTSLQVIAVAPNLSYLGAIPRSKYAVYVPVSNVLEHANPPLVVVRSSTKSGTGSLLRAIGSVVQRGGVASPEMEPPVPFSRAGERNIREKLDVSVFLLRLLSLAGAAVLVLTSIGVAGVTLHTVRASVAELGIRAALGGAPEVLVRLVMRREFAKIGVGAALGTIGPLYFFLRDPPQEIPISGVLVDPILGLCMGVALGLLLLSSYWPARGASRADPIAAIRGE